MYSFTIALVVLIVGYIVYGKFISKVFGEDPQRPTPATTLADGVDYVPMPTWKVYLVQFLNIAGLGPIFGAIMGAKFGTSSYLWIVFGTIFAGAVHDYMSGMMSLRHDGKSLPQLVGQYLGPVVSKIMIFFTLLLLILLVAVFVSQPADILAMMTGAKFNVYFWITVIFIYYILATMFPVDKLIGRIYPVFAVALLFMAVGILVMLYVKQPDLPELWDSFGTKYESGPIFPLMFISIACGAISGFHATQSPLMARCLKNEKYGRPVFYGAMVTEGIVALIWAAAATAFYQTNGADFGPGKVVLAISNDWLGTVGGILAVLGVVAAPISSGDTAMRAARLVVADQLHLEQKQFRNRLLICIPMTLLVLAALWFSLTSKDGFNIIWRYFSWSNQTLAVFTLWAITVYLAKMKKMYWVSLIPALFMTVVVIAFILMAPTAQFVPGQGVPMPIAIAIAGVATIGIFILFLLQKKK